MVKGKQSLQENKLHGKRNINYCVLFTLLFILLCYIISITIINYSDKRTKCLPCALISESKFASFFIGLHY